jgi:plastocyanin
MPSLRSIVLAAATASVAMAATHMVMVGESGLTFSPQMVTAAVGDVVEFQFYPKNHSVVAGDMTKGCTPMSSTGTSGFYSGFMPVTTGMSDMAFQVKIQNTEPWVFYCSQGKHCQNGMYGMINGNATALSAYGSLAKAATSNQSPSTTSSFGGTMVAATMSNGTTGGSGSTGGSGVVAASMGMTFAAFLTTLLLS